MAGRRLVVDMGAGLARLDRRPVLVQRSRPNLVSEFTAMFSTDKCVKVSGNICVRVRLAAEETCAAMVEYGD